MPVTVRQCYTCRHYRQMQEKIVLRDQKGEKTGTRQIYVDRRAARNLAELRVPVVDGEPIGLVLRAEFEKMLVEAKVERRPIPFIYGSEAQYHQGDAIIECPPMRGRRDSPSMKQFETRVEYMDAIAKAMGLGGIDDLANEHRNVLQVEHFARLAPILDMVETAAGQHEPLPFAEEDSERLIAEMVAINRVLLEHRDSKVKAVQALVAELDAILDGEEEDNGNLPQS